MRFSFVCCALRLKFRQLRKFTGSSLGASIDRSQGWYRTAAVARSRCCPTNSPSHPVALATSSALPCHWTMDHASNTVMHRQPFSLHTCSPLPELFRYSFCTEYAYYQTNCKFAKPATKKQNPAQTIKFQFTKQWF